MNIYTIILICFGVFLVWSFLGLFIYFQLRYSKKILEVTRTSTGLRFRVKRCREMKEGEFDVLSYFPAFLTKSKNLVKPAGNKRVNFYWGKYEVTPLLKIRDDYYEYIDFSTLMNYTPVDIIPANVQYWNNLRKVESYKRREKMKEAFERYGPTIVMVLAIVAFIISSIYIVKMNMKASDNAASLSNSCVNSCVDKIIQVCEQTVPQQNMMGEIISGSQNIQAVTT